MSLSDSLSKGLHVDGIEFVADGLFLYDAVDIPFNLSHGKIIVSIHLQDISNQILVQRIVSNERLQLLILLSTLQRSEV